MNSTVECTFAEFKRTCKEYLDLLPTLTVEESKAQLAQGELVAWRLMVRRADTEWRQYALYETEKAAQRTLEAVKGDPLIVKVEPLYTAPAFRELTDAEIDSCQRSGLIDSLLDPYDKENTGDECSSMYVDLREFARAVLDKARNK